MTVCGPIAATVPEHAQEAGERVEIGSPVACGCALHTGQADRRHAPERRLPGDRDRSGVRNILGDVALVVDAGENELGFRSAGEKNSHGGDDTIGRRTRAGVAAFARSRQGEVAIEG